MKSPKWAPIVLAALFIIPLVAGTTAAQVLEEAPKREIVIPDEHQGWIPHPVDRSHLRPVESHRMTYLQPGSWDWRALGGVTSVKNQNPYGTCWAFGTLGSLESMVLINEGGSPDYSAHNVAACANNWFYDTYGFSCNTGGNDVIATNYLTQLGTVDESCDTYPGSCPSISCVNPACSFGKQVTEWIVIPDDINAIKNALMNYGPVITSMYSSFTGFGSYNGVGCLTHTGSEPSDHCVLIVGWDDAMCDGNGGWIVKNSWGTGWGDNGYFYIEYGNANVGQDNSVFTGWKDIDSNESILYYDEYGWWSSVGWGDYDDWGMVEITPTASEHLLAVDFWAVSAPDTYTVYVYDTYSGGTLSDLLAGPISGTLVNAGYYSIALNPQIPVTTGDPIYIAIRFQTPGYNWPVPMDDAGLMETNKSFVRSDDASAWAALDNGGYAMGDAGIRARIGPKPETGECFMEGDPGFFYGFPSTVQDIYAGQTLCYEVAPTNFGFVSTLCPDPDTFCVHAVSQQGWPITGPDLDVCFILDPGYLTGIDVCITAPCDVSICDYDTIYAWNAYCDVNGLCAPDCGDCEDPNWYDGNPYYAIDTLYLHVIASPPALYIVQDSLYEVSFGQTAAYVPFDICNGDPCAPPTSYGYAIASTGAIPGAQQGASVLVTGGECEQVYWIGNAGATPPCTNEELTIIAWTLVEPVAYDTCIQLVHVIERKSVPLFTAPVVTILVLAMILSAAVFMRRRAVNKIKSK